MFDCGDNPFLVLFLPTDQAVYLLCIARRVNTTRTIYRDELMPVCGSADAQNGRGFRQIKEAYAKVPPRVPIRTNHG